MQMGIFIWALIASVLALWLAVSTWGFYVLFKQQKKYLESSRRKLSYYIKHDELPPSSWDE